jgi:hypothetical protein
LLTFDSGVSPPFGYQEHAIGGHVVDDRDAVSQLVDLSELSPSKRKVRTQCMTEHMCSGGRRVEVGPATPASRLLNWPTVAVPSETAKIKPDRY